LNEYLLYPSSIAFYGYGGSTSPISPLGRRKSYRISTSPSVQEYMAHVEELRRMNPSIPRVIFKPGESDRLEGENIGIKVTIHEDLTHKWHIDHIMFIPRVPGSNFYHERYDKNGNVIREDEVRRMIEDALKRLEKKLKHI